MQRKKEKIAETQLAGTLNELRVSQGQVESVIDAMGSADQLHNRFSGHYAKRLSNLDAHQKKLQIHRQAQEKQILTEKVKADRLEEKVFASSFDEDMQAQDTDLQDLIDALGAWKNTSSR